MSHARLWKYSRKVSDVETYRLQPSTCPLHGGTIKAENNYWERQQRWRHFIESVRQMSCPLPTSSTRYHINATPYLVSFVHDGNDTPYGCTWTQWRSGRRAAAEHWGIGFIGDTMLWWRFTVQDTTQINLSMGIRCMKRYKKSQEYKAKYQLNYSVLANSPSIYRAGFTRIDRRKYGIIPKLIWLL